MKRKREKPNELLKNALSIVSIVVVAALLIVLFRLKGGILGIVLGTVAVAALIYWLMELKKIFREQEAPFPEEAEWFYDLIEERGTIAFTGKVPGPAKEVKVKIVGDMLEIKGGRNFSQRVQIPRGTKLQDKSYIGGVLQVKLQRTEMPSCV
jgi:HSP20 family molecular chaperone IbpA